MAQRQEERLVKLFERATSADQKTEDIVLTLEITDRMSQRRRNTAEGIEYFKQLFKSYDLAVIQKTMTLLEACVKNCNQHFHRYICQRKMLPVFMNVLKRKRKKLTMWEKMQGCYKQAGWRDIERRALQLVQLWADTFMMDEERFPGFMQVYRELRQERIEFPARDPNERYMIKYEGAASPAFELAEMEENAERFREENPPPPPPPISDRERIAAMRRQAAPQEEGKELTEEDVQTITWSEVDRLKSSVERLENATRDAKSLNELLTEETKDSYRTARAVQKKVIVMASVRAGSTIGEDDTMDLLKIMDYLNNKVESFKKAVNIYKHGGNQVNVHDMLFEQNMADDFGGPASSSSSGGAGGLIDLGDFLDFPSENPLDLLDRFAEGGLASTAGVRQQPTAAISVGVVPEESKQVKPLTPPPAPATDNLLDFLDETPGQPDQAATASPADDFDIFLDLDGPPANVAAPTGAPTTNQAAPSDDFDFFSELASTHK